MMRNEYCERTGKKCFETKADASIVIKYYSSRNKKRYNKNGDIPKRAYQCPFCGMYHLTHLANQRRGKRKLKKTLSV